MIMEFRSMLLGDLEAVPGYWIRWQTAICALVIVVPALAAAVVAARARAEPLRAFDLWAPCWAGMHPAWLLAYRGLVSLGMLGLLSRMVLDRGLVEFYFYTQWTFALVTVYFMIGTIMSAHGCWIYSKTPPILHDEEANRVKDTVEQNNPVTIPFTTKKNMNVVRLHRYCDLQAEGKRAGFLGYTMQLVYQTSAGAALLTDLVFWTVLAPYSSSKHFRINAIMSCIHSLNAVFLLIDTFLNNLPFPLFRMAYFVFWSCSYVAFQWILHACGLSWWPYPFLDLDTPWSPVWYLSMALIHVPCYGLYWLIVRGKNSLCPKYFPNSFIKVC
ncbi:uncharacterized protein LOC122040879 [Zingiber officinale]|uniref:uncharacterized protein LOC122040879 n=1 Tax=Zingiber officinale TaxID=94328 RepID=UPI001C4CEE7E|nr:uncharacterized protein LOC122040879 [Zingiber officinale]